MRIGIIAWDLSGNCLVRVHPIAKVLERRHQVHVFGLQYGPSIYPPYQREFTYTAMRARWRGRFPPFLFDALQLRRALDCDLVYAFKPRISSFGVALLHKLRSAVPLMLDIEDWEAGGWYEAPARERLAMLRHAHSSMSDLHAPYMERLVHWADAVTVVSSFLQKRFGGAMLRHGCDSDVFDPKLYSKATCREQLGLRKQIKYVLFAGMVRPHKGVESLIRAVGDLGKHARLLVVGPRTRYLDSLLEIHSDVVLFHGPQEHSEMPRYLAAADIVALPQEDNFVTRAQVPGKVFEAMAMAKPIVASAVSDLPTILENAGWLVAPDDRVGLRDALSAIIDSPADGQLRGDRARARCEAEFSWDAMERVLSPLLDDLVPG